MLHLCNIGMTSTQSQKGGEWSMHAALFLCTALKLWWRNTGFVWSCLEMIRAGIEMQWIMRWHQAVFGCDCNEGIWCTLLHKANESSIERDWWLFVTPASVNRTGVYLHFLQWRPGFALPELLMTANEKHSIMLKERSVNHGLRNAVDNSHLWFTWSCLMHEPALHITEQLQHFSVLLCVWRRKTHVSVFLRDAKQHQASGFEWVWFLTLLL